MNFTYIATLRSILTNGSCELREHTSHPTGVHYLNIDFGRVAAAEPPTTTPQTTSNTMKLKKAFLIYNS